jgi:predicted Zn-dependent peptidase
MRIKKYFIKFTVLAIFLFQFAAFASAQTTRAPREEKLLNGMKLLVWSDKNAPKTTVSLRIHSGAAFDPAGKEGVMSLLSDILFPNTAQFEYFAEDLGGNLGILSGYDYIQIDASGDNDKILEILEALAQAITRPQIDKDTTAQVKTKLLETVKMLEKNPVYVADLAVANRLFGNYPYGRPTLGTTETLSKIDFADLLLAKQKFLTADNATLAVSGNVNSDLVYRAVRRYFGAWQKADKKVPATFTQPDEPKTEILKIAPPLENFKGIRIAFRSLSRNDKDFFAAQIYTNILQNRLLSVISPSLKDTFFIRNETRLLPGFIIFGYTKAAADIKPLEEKPDTTNKPKSFGELMTMPVTEEEFNSAKAAALDEMKRKSVVEMWLDADTYKLVSVKDDLDKMNNVTRADVQRVLENLTKNPRVGVSFEQPKTEEKPAATN